MAGQGSARRRRLASLSVVCAVTIVLLALVGGIASSLLPGTLLSQVARWAAAAAVFADSYFALAVGRDPRLAIERLFGAPVGACLVVAGGALPLGDVCSSVDLDSLTLLLGMMIVVVNLRFSDF